MSKNSEDLFILIFFVGAVATVLCFWLGTYPIEANLTAKISGSEEINIEESLATVQGNSLLPVNNKVVVRKMNVIATGYSSSPDETDETPLITASGDQVRAGIVANNLLPFGTEIRIPELYGDTIFVIEDRMHWRKGYYHVDIWFPSKEEAKNFGAKDTYIEVLEG